MKTKLFSIVSFAAVAAGASVSLPHGLNLADGANPIVPDEIKRRTTGDFTITADDTDITVVNNGATEGDVDVLSEHWYSAERQLGVDDDGVSNLPIQPWESQSSSAANQSTTVQWSPDAPANKLMPGRIFGGFEDCLGAGQARVAEGFANVEMLFNNSFSATLDVNGFKTTRVPTSAVNGSAPQGGLVANVWDFSDIGVGGGGFGPSGLPSAGDSGVNITFEDGAIIQNTDTNLVIKIMEGVIHNDVPGHTPIYPAPNWGVLQNGAVQCKFAADVGAGPLFAPDPFASFHYYPTSDNGNGGFGYGVGSPSPAPILDFGGIFTVVAAEGNCIWIDDNAFTDSVGTGGITLQGPFRNGRGNDGAGEHPGLGAADTGSYFRNQQKFNLKIPVMMNQYSSGFTTLFGDGDTLTPGICYCDATAADITVKAPCQANPMSGTNVWIIPVGGFKVTLDPYAVANVRNVGGVADGVDTPAVLTATKGLFVANGGMDGSDIGRWERFI